MIRTIHRAKYVLAEADLLLPNAAVHVSSSGRISRVEAWHSPPAGLDAEVVDWGSALILPGLVNAHTHLELTSLHGQLTRFSSFTDWLWQLIQKRQEWKRDDYLTSTRRGARLALSSGTTLVGDISASGVSWEALKIEKLRKVVFEETLSFIPEKAVPTLAAFEARLEIFEPDELLSVGISPHAPYSVSADLYRGLFDLARRKGLQLATHAAETPGELEFLQSGTGEFHGFLAKLGVLQAGWEPPGLAPVRYLAKLGILALPSILIHCNYLDEESMATIRNSRSSVVYCPRSHAFFGHADHPVRKVLNMGINVALGTDSLASNDSLSILDEMRFLFKTRKDLNAAEIFRMSTLNGAVALGFGSKVGRLRRGYWADMAILELPQNLGARNLSSHILEGAGELAATIVQGETAWTRP